MGYTCERANRLTSFNGDTVLYDDNGNMTSWGDATFTWDARNRLIAINGTSLSASFKYDSMGRRVEKTVNGTTTKYLYDGADIIMEMNGSGTPTAYYIRTLNIDEPLARVDLLTGEIRFYIADALGSIIALADENGVVKTRYNYTPFGEVEVTGESSDNPFMFTGREWDRLGDSPGANGTGLYYYRARYYSPGMGRFISEDPIGLAGGINMYAYVGNNPLNFVDPLGLDEYSADEWSRAFTGMNYYDALADMYYMTAVNNERYKREAEVAACTAEFYGDRADFWNSINYYSQGAPPSDGLFLDLFWLVVQAASYTEYKYNDYLEDKYLSKYDKFKKLIVDVPPEVYALPTGYNQ